MSVSLSTRKALQFWVPDVAYFSLVYTGSVRLSLVNWKRSKVEKSFPIAYSPGSQSEVPGPATLASPGYSLEIQILRPHPKPTESDTLGV